MQTCRYSPAVLRTAPQAQSFARQYVGRVQTHVGLLLDTCITQGRGRPDLPHEAADGLGAVHQLVGRDVVADDLAHALAAVVTPVPAVKRRSSGIQP